MKLLKKWLASLLVVCMVFGIVPVGVTEEVQAATGETTYVLAGSDFQARGGHDAGAEIVSGLLDAIKEDYSTMDGFLFAGDYDVNYNDSANGQRKLQETVQSVYGSSMDEVYIQGNHDEDGFTVGVNYSPSGDNDTDNYGVFVINENDYMWYNSDVTTIKKTADNLESYLNAKRNAEYTKPIFVISHLPLHYNMRTRTNGNGDGKYANYIFDVLNEAGNAGLNIIFMFGHNHSHGWDDYLGGAAIFLTHGDKINIAQSSTTVFEEETLAFTYMNAGYVGYYGDSYNSTVDKTLTMTTFAITDDDVTISRYDANGPHNLKSAGVYNVEYPDSSYYSADTSVVGTPYELSLNKTISPAGEEVTPPDIGNTDGEIEDTIEQVTTLEQGVPYIIVCNRTDAVLTGTTIKNGQNDALLLSGTASTDTQDLWYYDGTHLIYGDPNSTNTYLLMSSGSAYLGETPSYRMVDDVYLNEDGSTFTLKRTDDNLCLNQYGGPNSTVAAGYASDGNSDPGSKWRIYKVISGTEEDKVETSGGDWVTITESTHGTARYVYELDTDGIDDGKEYLIVANEDEKALSKAASSNNAVNIDITDNLAYADSDEYDWTFTTDGSYKRIRLNDKTYLGYNNGLTGTETWPSNDNQRNRYRWGVTGNGNGSYNIKRDNSYLGWSGWNGTFRVNWLSSSVRLYKYVGQETIGGNSGFYAKLSGNLAYDIVAGTSPENALAAVKKGIDVITATEADYSDASALVDDNNKITWSLDSSYDGTPGEYAVTIAYDGKTLGVAKVVVPSVSIDSYYPISKEGSVQKGSRLTTETGTEIRITLKDGNFYNVKVTLDMLQNKDGSKVSTANVGTYENLVLTYNGVQITDEFTLHVLPKTGNNYPEYPNEGAVKVNKTATGIDFQSSGIAKVEVSASGVPVKKGVDVIVMLDLSSSMTNTINGVSRLNVLKESLRNLFTQFKQVGEDGQPLDIRVAMADFNRYYTDNNSKYYINANDTLAGGKIRTNAAGTNLVYTGTKDLTAGAFVDVSNLSVNIGEQLNTSSGTNYDYAFDAIYQLGDAITKKNEEVGEERDLFVIFMTDGAPFQYNYFSAQSTENYWNNWLQGTMTEAMFGANSNRSYYHEDGKHWMAEAIKGTPGESYPVIRKNDPNDDNNDNWVEVNGLGATMFSVAFCLANDSNITTTSMEHAISRIASKDNLYFSANSASDLDDAFKMIGNEITYAATNARFVDQMGDNYNLQIKPATYNVVENGQTVSKTITPKIEIISYDIYTRQDYLNNIITQDKIGDRKGTYTILETVTFNDDGTEAYSDQIGNGTINILADGTQNGYEKGVIYARTFLYNTNISAVAVDGVDIPTGVSADGTTGSTNVLPSETFYWKMGTVQSSELAMRYDVYLEGAMEGTMSAGSHSTNEYAILYYDNYLGNACKQETTSPTVAWKSANVSYAFYLVNENGEIIVNQTTGETGSFANKVAVTKPVVYKEIPLNNTDQVQAIDVKAMSDDVLPKYYDLYDIDSEYKISVYSNSTGSWEIKKGASKVASTYITNYSIEDASAYTNKLQNNTVGDDYTHTIVWFAVVWRLNAHPDTVVVDYGLPVDISVLSNDMFGDYGKLAKVGPYTTGLEERAADPNTPDDFGEEYEGTYGRAVANTSTGKVRYTLNSMSFNGYEKFAYAVNYTGGENNGYYYDTVTVIPATTVYFEDEFLTYTGYGAEWSKEGTAVQAVQDEDRPGKYSLTDANNIYGYDSVNLGMSVFSLGSAMKVHISGDEYATAEFSFYGTGFDVISMTSNTTGTIAVNVKNSSGQDVANKIVNTYYGYKYENGEWIHEPDIDKAMYQVPVLQIEELPYGKYDVKITATYASILDKTSGDDGYDLYLDAIRIYDPANDGLVDGTEDKTIENVYLTDGEGWPSYIELRNKMIEKNSFDNDATAVMPDFVEGLVFIDGDNEVGNEQMADYISYGPNNEIYLAPGQRVAFLLAVPENVANVHIGIKSADGNVGTYTITNIAKSDNAEVGVEAGTYYGARTRRIDTTTDMYYDLTGWINDIIVISNTGNRDENNTSGIISLTNIKSTYTSDPGENESAVVTPTPTPEADARVERNETYIYMTPEATEITLKAINSSLDSDVEDPDDNVPAFEDVNSNEFFYDAVYWAVKNNITTGIDATHFAPQNECTRGQMVTFLYREAGSPDVKATKNPFVDVKESSYYYNAVLWAIEKGITTGTDATHFSPEALCTRAQMVTFLYREVGEPSVVNSENPFSDVNEASYYYDAVLWAMEKGITTGTDAAHFSPDDMCLRGQAITFIYRTFK